MTIAFRPTRDSKFIAVGENDGFAFCEATWYMAHSLGIGPVIGETKAHVSGPGGWIYDARILSPEAEVELARLDAAVKAAQQARREYLNEKFRQWPPVTRANAPRIVPQKMTKAQANAALKAAPKPSADQLRIGRQTVSALNRTLR